MEKRQVQKEKNDEIWKMEDVKKIMIEGREIIVLDYSDCKEPQMIKILTNSAELIIKENKRV